MTIFRSKIRDVTFVEKSVHSYIFDKVPNHKDRIALVNQPTDTPYSYQAVFQHTKNVAQGLKNLGLQKGDVLAIMCPNSPEFAFVCFGALSLGGVVTTLNPSYKHYEVTKQLESSEAKFLFTSNTLVDTGIKAARDLGIEKIITMGGSVPGCIEIETLLKTDGGAFDLGAVSIDPKEDLAFLLYSSGTTGLPKGVMLTHFNIVSNMQQFQRTFYEGVRDDYIAVELGFMPFFHIFGLVGMLCNCLALGNQLVILPRFLPEPFLASIEKYKVTNLSMVPPILLFIINSPLTKKYDLTSLKVCGCGAAPLAKHTQDTFEKMIGGKRLEQGYGLTETSPIVSVCNDPNMPVRGSAGVLIANTELKVVDVTTNKALGVGDRGELCFRGPQIMKGYWKNPEQTSAVIDSDGFLHTGDIGYMDENDLLFIVDRLKELIKYKGFQVAPAELESVLLNHPDVADVGVIGIPDPDAGELPKAFIVTKPGKDANEQSIHDYMAEHLASFKQLKGGVAFVAQIPKSPSGKILRKELKEKAMSSQV